ncbi:hypothetical protein LINPERPRIM_LOCUS36456, partial [Linum perenne]
MSFTIVAWPIFFCLQLRPQYSHRHLNHACLSLIFSKTKTT